MAAVAAAVSARAFTAAPSVRPVRASPHTVAHGMIGPGKSWEHYKLNQNGKPVRPPLHVKTGDKVVVIAGDDKGTTGVIKQVYTKTSQVLIEGVNISIRHKRAASQDEPGERVEVESPINASNVMHWSESQQTRSRLGTKVVDGKKVRYLKKTGEVLDN
eukprot:TRINITY_DN6681_c0_g1_i1.p2 TRINITY_DN6681_c0_g1~~TRINITY_DN6681_c0_g1_i1.p2  ORF type:complete len:182 (+),score=18.42 TRINITY_DN6681_c0_g1_i1:70-546(+)